MKDQQKSKKEIKIVSRPSNEEIEEDLTIPVKKWQRYPSSVNDSLNSEEDTGQNIKGLSDTD